MIGELALARGGEPAPTDGQVAIELLLACPGCGAELLEEWLRGRDRVHRVTARSFGYSRCRSCGLIFLAERPIAAEIHRFYPEDYGPYQDATAAPRSHHQDRSRRKSTGRNLLRVLNRRLERWWPDRIALKLRKCYTPPPGGGLLLDYGCGSSRFLNLARDLGFDTIGVDLSPAVLARVRDDGHRAYAAPAVWEAIEDGSLSVARLHHSLEHLYEPHQVLRNVADKLSSSGVLHVGLPDPVGLSARLFGSRWWGLECPRHLFLFSVPVISRALIECGLRVTDVLHEAAPKDLVRSLGHAVSDWGLMQPEAVPALSGATTIELLRFPLRGLARLGLGDRFHILARKAPAGVPCERGA